MVLSCENGRRESFGLARVRINEVRISKGLLYRMNGLEAIHLGFLGSVYISAAYMRQLPAVQHVRDGLYFGRGWFGTELKLKKCYFSLERSQTSLNGTRNSSSKITMRQCPGQPGTSGDASYVNMFRF